MNEQMIPARRVSGRVRRRRRVLVVSSRPDPSTVTPVGVFEAALGAIVSRWWPGDPHPDDYVLAAPDTSSGA